MNTGVDTVSDISGEAEVSGVNDTSDIRALLESAASAGTDDGERARGEDGRFIKADAPVDGEAPAVTPVDGEAPAVTLVDGEAPAVTPVEAVPVEALPALASEYQELVSALPETERAKVAKVLAERENAWQQYAEQTTSRVREYDEVEKVIGPRRQAFALQGTSPGAAINQLFALSDFASRDPSEFIQWFAGNHNIDLTAIGETYLPPDPQISQMQQELAQLRSQVQGYSTRQTEAEQGNLVAEVTAFQNSVDASGLPVYPHFNVVANEMLPMVSLIRSQNPAMGSQQVLKEAYDRAVYANPTTRAALLKQAQDTALAARSAESVNNLARAKNAAQSVTGAAPNGSAVSNNPIPADTVRGALEAAYSRLN